MVEQVISQQTAEPEEVAVRRSSLLDEAIRQLQEQQDRQNQPETGAVPEGPAEAQGPVLAPAPSTPRRGISTPSLLHWIGFSTLEFLRISRKDLKDLLTASIFHFSVRERPSRCAVTP